MPGRKYTEEASTYAARTFTKLSRDNGIRQSEYRERHVGIVDFP